MSRLVACVILLMPFWGAYISVLTLVVRRQWRLDRAAEQETMRPCSTNTKTSPKTS